MIMICRLDSAKPYLQLVYVRVWNVDLCIHFQIVMLAPPLTCKLPKASVGYCDNFLNTGTNNRAVRI